MGGYLQGQGHRVEFLRNDCFIALEQTSPKVGELTAITGQTCVGRVWGVVKNIKVT